MQIPTLINQACTHRRDPFSIWCSRCQATSLYHNSFADIDDHHFNLLSEWHGGSQAGQEVDNLELIHPDFDDGIQLQFSGQLQPDWQAQEETQFIIPSLNHRPVLGQTIDPTPSQYGIAWAAPWSVSGPSSPKSELGSQWHSAAQAAEPTAFEQHGIAPTSASNLSQSSPIPPSSKRAGPGFDCTECGGRLRSKQSLRNHIEAKHKKNKPYTCAHCKAKFSYHQSWRRHDRKSRCPVIHGQAGTSPT